MANSTSTSILREVREFFRTRWHLVLLGLLISAQLAINWAWLSTNVVLLGWDRPRHLIESLVYNDILEQVTLRSLFEAWTHSGYYPPLFHMAMVALYKVFGISMDVAASVNMVFLVVLLLAAYGIGREMGGRGVGLLSAFVASTLPMIFCMSRYTYIEFALTAMVAVSMWLLLLSRGFSSKAYSLLFGLSAGLGLLTKWTYSLFVFPALVIVIVRSGLLARATTGLRSLSWDRKRLVVSALAGAVLTLVWYVPNVELVGQLPLRHLLLPCSWFLLGGVIYLLGQPSSPGWNLVGSLWFSLAVAGSWYLARPDFVNHTFLIAWGRPERQSWAFEYYLDHLTNEHMSLFYMAVLAVVSIGLLIPVWRALRPCKSWKRVLTSDFLLLALWIVLPYLVFSFRPSSKHSRFIMPILPALAVVVAYGLSRIRLAKLRLAVVTLVVLVGAGQWLALSFDGLGWLREAAVVGPVNVFAHMFQNQLPNSGETDSRFWVVPEILQHVADEAEARGRPLELGLLVNTRQVHDEHFLYLIYTDFPEVRLLELAQNWTGRPAYPQLFEVDYVAVPSANPDHKIDAESLEVVEAILDGPPALFGEAFQLVQEYAQPDGNVIYLYEKVYSLPEGYEAEHYESLAEEVDLHLRDGDALILFPDSLVTLLGRYYLGRPDLFLLPPSAGGAQPVLTQTLEEALAGHGRLAVVLGEEQGEQIQSAAVEWLNEHCLPVFDATYGPTRLTVCANVPIPAGSASTGAPEADFGGQIELAGHSPVPRRIEAGEVLPLTLLWQARAQVETDYKVFLHLLDAQHSVVAQRDSQPVGGLRPTTSWSAGEVIRDSHGILLPRCVAAGEYQLVVGLYDGQGARLAMIDELGREAGDSLSLGTVQVAASCFCEAKEATTERVKYQEIDE